MICQVKIFQQNVFFMYTANTQVIFSAAAGGTGVIGPINADITLIYRTVITNIGSAYSPITGKNIIEDSPTGLVWA